MLTPFLNKYLREKFFYLGQDEIDVALAEFEKFVTLALHSPEIFLPCSKIIDDIWHASILETREYAALCDAIKPNSYLHHSGVELSDYMVGRSLGDQDDQGISVLVSYVANFGRFKRESVKYWIVADDIMIRNGWSLSELNDFLQSLMPGGTELKMPDEEFTPDELIQKFHRDTAGTTEAYFSGVTTSIPSQNTYEILVETCASEKLKPNLRAVDIGCGIGTLYRYLDAVFPLVEYFGIDNSPDEISIGRRAMGGPRASLICADALEMPLRDAHFDLAVSHMTMHILPDPHKIFREISRVLNRGGIFCLTVPARKYETPGEYAYQHAISLFSRFENGVSSLFAPGIYEDQLSVLATLDLHFGGAARIAKEYTLRLDPKEPNTLVHFTGLYPYAMLNRQDRTKFKNVLQSELEKFSIANPGVSLERRMAVYMTTKE